MAELFVGAILLIAIGLLILLAEDVMR